MYPLNLLKPALSLLTVCLLVTNANAETKPDCFVKAEDVSKVMGFKVSAPKVDNSYGLSCEYAGQAFSLRLLFKPLSGVPFDQYLQFSYPKDAKRHAVAGDPDKALILSQSKSLQVPDFAQIVYERKGYLVEWHVAGGVYEAKTRDAVVAAHNQALLKLPRAPK